MVINLEAQQVRDHSFTCVTFRQRSSEDDDNEEEGSDGGRKRE